MSYNCFPRNCSPRPLGGRCVAPAAVSNDALETGCQGGIYLPSSFQGNSWLLDHCQETCCEPVVCQQTTCISGPAQLCRPSPCPAPAPCQTTTCTRPLGFVTGPCQTMGGISSLCQPACTASRTYQRSCVTSCRSTC
ncbi:keratin-associated protein 11-1 [Ornithorhynchus anatinus]|uniref:keratin-associated protein 11-1 n=1 Tax=Ornithorhynchus anatinus TaxID=9258 RepID=UPI0000EDAEC3|nr:keratin-associated protein 11-1 [Ornithorhynchus anatinus]